MKLTFSTSGLVLLLALVVVVSRCEGNLFDTSHDSSSDDDEFTIRAVQVVDKASLFASRTVAAVGAYQISPSAVIVPKELVEGYDPKYKHLVVVSSEDHEEHPVVYIWKDEHHLSKYPGKAVLYIFNRDQLADIYEKQVKKLEAILGDDSDSDEDRPAASEQSEDKEGEQGRRDFWAKFLARLRQKHTQEGNEEEQEEPQSSNLSARSYQTKENESIDKDFGRNDSKVDEDSKKSLIQKTENQDTGSEDSQNERKSLLLQLLFQRLHQLRQQQQKQEQE